MFGLRKSFVFIFLVIHFLVSPLGWSASVLQDFVRKAESGAKITDDEIQSCVDHLRTLSTGYRPTSEDDEAEQAKKRKEYESLLRENLEMLLPTGSIWNIQGLYPALLRIAVEPFLAPTPTEDGSLILKGHSFTLSSVSSGVRQLKGDEDLSILPFSLTRFTDALSYTGKNSETSLRIFILFYLPIINAAASSPDMEGFAKSSTMVSAAFWLRSKTLEKLDFIEIELQLNAFIGLLKRTESNILLQSDTDVTYLHTSLADDGSGIIQSVEQLRSAHLSRQRVTLGRRFLTICKLVFMAGPARE